MRGIDSRQVTDRSPPCGQQFGEWSKEHDAVDAALDRTPESSAEERDRLLDRFFELEHLILNTPGQEPAAILAKARTLRRMMELEQSAELPVMREIESFVNARTAGETAAG